MFISLLDGQESRIGPYAGKRGNLVSIPWLGNGYNLRAEINVPSGEVTDFGERNMWVKCWWWELECEFNSYGYSYDGRRALTKAEADKQNSITVPE